MQVFTSFIPWFNCSREERSHIDTAYAIAWANQNSNIAALTPVSTPGVLNDPILLFCLVIGTITNQKDCVIKVGWASIVIINDASFVAEPGRVSSTYTDWDRSNIVKRGLELGCVLMSHIPVVVDTYNVLANIIIAITITTLVRIVFVCFETIVPYVIIDPVWKATTATLILVGIWAIDDLLNW